ncbi:alpha/beta fold hydrolase [Novosphingobium sp. Gsoil 351]|uniref:alpha/beta fold hydrolase n=1 Tax=Novosphingobium sp. Gsoil 351 TaxID=2675225 RepID=UPI0018A81B8B|nr:alpha/beta hydrolase [Novosphingobium sp. Gsoil 351]
MDIPIVALCGMASDSASWHGMPVDRIEVPRGPTIAAMAERIITKLPPRFALCGHSMGGYVALEIALREPDRLTALALICSSATPDTPEQYAARWALIDLALRDFEMVARRLARALPGPKAKADQVFVNDLEAMIVRCGVEAFVEQQEAVANRPDYRDRLSSIVVSTMVLAGAEDRIVAPDRSREIADLVPSCTLQIIPECGHIPQWERPALVHSALDKWRNTATENH